MRISLEEFTMYKNICLNLISQTNNISNNGNMRLRKKIFADVFTVFNEREKILKQIYIYLQNNDIA